MNKLLAQFIKKTKEKRQVIIVAHNRMGQWLTIYKGHACERYAERIMKGDQREFRKEWELAVDFLNIYK